jgi:hypothetical protein
MTLTVGRRSPRVGRGLWSARLLNQSTMNQM